jgi:hypothetical protein
MKRFTSLSALLVGLSVTTASFAGTPDAPSATKADKPMLVAQADDPAGQTPPAPTEAPEAAAPTAAPTEAPAPAPETASQGAQIGSGTSTPVAADTTTDSEKAKKKEHTWGGSAIIGYTTMSTSTVFRAQQQYADPTVDSSIWLMPRYNLNDQFQLRGRLIFNYEWTNSDTTVTEHEPRFSDTTVQLVYKKIPEIGTIKPLVGIQVAAPTSPESRARTMRFNPGVLASASKTFEHIGSGSIDIGGSAIYSHPIYGSTQAEVRGHRQVPLQCAGGTDCSDLLSGKMNSSDTLTYTISISGKWGKWSPALYFLGASQWVYHPKDTDVAIAGGQKVPVEGQPGGDRSSIRQSGYFSASLDYEVTPWFSPEIGYSLYRNILAEDGTYGNPLFDPYQDMRVFVGATIDPDEMIRSLKGQPRETKAAKAEAKSPVFRY